MEAAAQVVPDIEKVPTEGDMESDPALSRASELEVVQPWQEQLTVRGLVAAMLIGFVYTVIVMKLILTTGLVPTLNVSTALVSFVMLRGWTHALHRLGIASRPFTRQENTIIQACADSCFSVATSGGFGSTLLGLNKKTYELAGKSLGNVPGSYKEPGIGWMTILLLTICFGGLFSLIPLKKILVIDYKLTYPSGTVTAVLINGFHITKGDKNAKFFFDFSLTYVGAGMICSHLVNLSTLLGAILSWGIMWPLISKRKGDWYPGDVPASSMKSLYGYKAFFCIALILGDGLYQFMKIVYVTSKSVYQKANSKDVTNRAATSMDDIATLEELQRDEVFRSGKIPSWIAYTGYALFTIISTISIPLMFRPVKWYYVIVAYAISPILGFSNTYGSGLTDINMAYNYGKIALFIFAAWSGKENGVIAGLVGGTVVKQLVLMSADLMQDLKTSHLTLTSPRSMIVAQTVGTALGCIISPLTFMLFYKAFDVGNPDGYWKAPYALVYRSMAILGVEGFSTLPKHCLTLSAGIFAFSMLSSIARDMLPKKYGKYVPLPMAMAVPFLVGGSFAIDMCVGSLVLFVWEKINKKEAGIMVHVVASALICGDGIWTFPSSLLALAKINPPICMKCTPAE